MEGSFGSGPVPGCPTSGRSGTPFRRTPTERYSASSCAILHSNRTAFWMSDSAISATAFLQRQRRVDQADVGEGLRKVAQGRATLRVDFFGQQAQVVRISKQGFKRLGRAGDVAGPRPTLHSPEGADAKCALARREAIIRTCLIPVDQAAASKLLVDRAARR